MQTCYKMLGGRDFDSIPKSPVLLYEHELLFEALNLAFSNPHVTHALASDAALINKLVPDVMGHLHVEASSEARQRIPQQPNCLKGLSNFSPLLPPQTNDF